MSEQDIEIRLTNAVTGQKHSFSLSETASPTLINKIDERDRLTRKFQKLDDDDRQSAERLITKVTALGMEIMSCILEPEELPDEYDTKLDLIKNCVSNGMVVSEVIRFFFSNFKPPTSDASESSQSKGLEIIKPDTSSR